MTVLAQIPLSDLRIAEDYFAVAPGALMLITHGDAPCVGMRAFTDGQGGPAMPGFVPLEGQQLGIFQNNYVLSGGPSVLADELLKIVVQQLEPSQVSSHPIQVGDVCFLPGHPDACLAVASNPGQEPDGFLVLGGKFLGEILRRYRPHIRVGRIALETV